MSRCPNCADLERKLAASEAALEAEREARREERIAVGVILGEAWAESSISAASRALIRKALHKLAREANAQNLAASPPPEVCGTCDFPNGRHRFGCATGGVRVATLDSLLDSVRPDSVAAPMMAMVRMQLASILKAEKP